MTGSPRGCSYWGGEAAAALLHLQNTFLSRFKRFGYQQFWPSGLQTMETAWRRLPEEFHNRLVAITTPYGELCCLRGDLTLSAISYLAGHHAPEERPLRLCYAERVYRAPEGPVTEMERLQVGAELLGWDGKGADVELLWLLLSALQEAGAGHCMLVLGDIRILEGLLTGTEPRYLRQFHDALLADSLPRYLDVIERAPLDPETKRMLRALPHLKGHPEVLQKARCVLGDSTVLQELREILDALEALGFGDSLFVDLSLVRELDYYNGPIFEVYTPTSGMSIGGGGRYDGLLAKYNLLGQALGFGLDMEQLARECRQSLPGKPAVLLWSGGLAPQESIRYANTLTAAGAVVEFSWEHDRRTSQHLGALRRYRWWARAGENRILDLETQDDMDIRDWKERYGEC
ncbi:MAG: ATP phosphoribosyltransferase regulatory subunit [Synergistales bacterium]|nr:ATP phosphoribosyltransferase regulatory subunit [Synergistales bacterium]